MPDRREPPRLVVLALFAALAALLFHPLHRPYLHPDQDVLPTLPLLQMARGSWSPLLLIYGSALPNLLHLVDALLLHVGRLVGWWQTPTDMLVAWCEHPWLFRIPTRAIAMTAGLGSLLAARGITALVADRWTALVAPALLGSWLVFVREHHHGLYDAPASGVAMLALWSAVRFARTGSRRTLILAGALAGLAVSCKYNLLPVVPAVLAAALTVPRGRLRAALVAGTSAAIAFALTTPEAVLEPQRLWETLSVFVPLQAQVLAVGAGREGNQLVAALVRGIGWTGLGLAALGFVVAVLRREKALLPLLAFVVLYGIVLARSPLVIGRYAVPIAGPLAVLAAYALARLPLTARLATATAVVVVGLPGIVGHVRLLATEDTRTGAARLVDAEWAAGGRVVVVANPILWMYVGPDVAQLPRYEGMPADVTSALATRAPRCVRPMEVTSGAPPAGALVVTSESPSPPFAHASTPPAVIAALERDATLVADLPVERTASRRDYEPFDLNYMPWSGFDSLARPGPHIRLWRLPPAP